MLTNNSFDMTLLMEIPYIESDLREKDLKEFKSLQSDLIELREISQLFSNMIHLQHENLTTVEKNIELTAHKVESGLNELKNAKSYFYSYRILQYGVFAGLLIINTPIALLYGTKIAAVTTSTSLITAYFAT